MDRQPGITRMALSETEEALFVQQTGFKPLEAKGVIAIIDTILAAREKDRLAQIETDRYLDRGGF